MENVLIEKEVVNHICKSCGNEFTGTYCNNCGEKVLEPNGRVLKSFLLSITWATLLHNKFLHALKLIIVNPGFLSKEYAEGRRVNYFRPLQLFFILNLIYFLFPLLQLFNTSLHTQMFLRTHSALVRSMVYSKINHEGIDLQGFGLMYNEKSTSLAKLLVVVFAVVASLPMNLIYRRKNRYFTDHVTLALELTSFNLAMNAIFLSFVLMIINFILHWGNLGWTKYLNDFTLTIIFVMTNTYFLFKAGSTFYGQKGKWLILKVLFGLLGLFVALELYRLILFLVTFWSL
jgi:hypothetical protein